MTLFWLPEGPRIRYKREYDYSFKNEHMDFFLVVDDLNPEKEIKFKMSHWELFCLGLNCIWASVWP